MLTGIKKIIGIGRRRRMRFVVRLINILGRKIWEEFFASFIVENLLQVQRLVMKEEEEEMMEEEIEELNFAQPKHDVHRVEYDQSAIAMTIEVR